MFKIAVLVFIIPFGACAYCPPNQIALPNGTCGLPDADAERAEQQPVPQDQVITILHGNRREDVTIPQPIREK